MYEMQYESLPSVGLTIYVILVRLTDSNYNAGESSSTALHASILTSLMSITYSTLRIFIKNITKNTFAMAEHTNEEKKDKETKTKMRLTLEKIRSRSTIDSKFASEMHIDTPENSKQLSNTMNSTQVVELVVNNNLNNTSNTDNNDNSFVSFSPQLKNDHDGAIIYDEKCDIDDNVLDDNISVDQLQWNNIDVINAHSNSKTITSIDDIKQFKYFFKFENLHFAYFILYSYMLTDFYCRVFPNLILFCLLRTIISSDIFLYLLITMSIVLIFLIEYILSKWIRIRIDKNNHDHDERKDILYYLFVLYFSSLVNVLFSLPMKRFSSKIDFRKFFWAQMIRLFVGLIIEIGVLIANNIQILPFLHGLYACLFCSNIVIICLIHKAKYPQVSIRSKQCHRCN